jgi:hypothetical protein
VAAVAATWTTTTSRSDPHGNDAPGSASRRTSSSGDSPNSRQLTEFLPLLPFGGAVERGFGANVPDGMRSAIARVRRFRATPSSLGTLGVLAIVALHVPRLIERLRDASFTEPGVLLRWLLVPIVLGALLALRRRGVSLVRGRGALALWLLILLIHALPAPGNPVLVAPAPAAALALLLVAVSIAGALRRTAERVLRRPVARVFALPSSPELALAGFSPRPPPRTSRR